LWREDPLELERFRVDSDVAIRGDGVVGEFNGAEVRDVESDGVVEVDREV